VKRVVADTGPILHLSEADALEVLAPVGEVRIPCAVEQELAAHCKNWQDLKPDWILETNLAEPHCGNAIAWEQSGLLGFGEAEAIALAQQTQAHWLLTDDSVARLFAESLGLETHGSLGVILWAAAVGHIGRADAEQVLYQLYETTLWVSLRIRQEIEQALDELFA